MKRERPLFIKNRETGTGINIPAAEDAYNAKYIGDFCTKRLDGVTYNQIPVAVFYQEHPRTDLGHSHYFGLYRANGSVFIIDAKTATEEPITGVVADNGEVIYSSSRYDYVKSEDGSVMVDGGREYCRTSWPVDTVNIIFNGPNLEILGNE